jgi:hypothetical protein
MTTRATVCRARRASIHPPTGAHSAATASRASIWRLQVTTPRQTAPRVWQAGIRRWMARRKPPSAKNARWARPRFMLVRHRSRSAHCVRRARTWNRQEPRHAASALLASILRRLGPHHRRFANPAKPAPPRTRREPCVFLVMPGNMRFHHRQPNAHLALLVHTLSAEVLQHLWYACCAPQESFRRPRQLHAISRALRAHTRTRDRRRASCAPLEST